MKTGRTDWQGHVEALNREATSVQAYASRHGLSVSTLYYWRQKLKIAPEATRPHQAGRFIALHVDGPATNASVYTVSLASGVRLEMPTLPPPEWLAALACAIGAR